VGTSASEKSERRLGDASRRPLAPLSGHSARDRLLKRVARTRFLSGGQIAPVRLARRHRISCRDVPKAGQFPFGKICHLRSIDQKTSAPRRLSKLPIPLRQCLPRVGTRNGHQWSARRPFRPAPGVNASRAERSNREQARCRHFGNGRRLLVRRDLGTLRNRRRRRRRRTISRIVFGQTG
jgi:hypothetical protein